MSVTEHTQETMCRPKIVVIIFSSGNYRDIFSVEAVYIYAVAVVHIGKVIIQLSVYHRKFV